MKEGWEYKKLGDFCRKGKNIKWDDQTNDTSFRYIDLTSVDRNDLCIHNPQIITKDNAPSRAKQIIQAGDIIFATTRPTLRRVSLIDEQYDGDICSTGFCVLRPNKEVKSKIIFYALLNDSFYKYIEPLQTGANYPAVTDSIVKNYIIPVPPLSEQQSIVDYLDSAFAKIDAMKANAEKALNEAKALFQASLKEMLEPKEGWEEKALKDFAIDMYRGSGVKRDQVTEDGIPCVRYGEIYTKYNYHFNECDSYTLAEYVNSPKYFEYGDILFAITGESVEDIGKSIAYTGKDKCIAGGDMVVMKHSYEPRYISYALSTPAAIKQKGRGKTKLKVVHTNIPSLKEIIIPIAPIGDQKHIADTLDSLKSKVDKLQENYDKISQECDALKQAILRQVFE